MAADIVAPDGELSGEPGEADFSRPIAETGGRGSRHFSGSPVRGHRRALRSVRRKPRCHAGNRTSHTAILTGELTTDGSEPKRRAPVIAYPIARRQ